MNDIPFGGKDSDLAAGSCLSEDFSNGQPTTINGHCFSYYTS
jgi:hypothetical protein